MKLHVRGRLFLASVGVVIAVIAVAGVFAQTELQRWLASRIEDELLKKLAAVSVTVERSASAPDDVLADALGAALAARVTIVDARGAVVGDSEVDEALIASVENH